MQYTVEQDNAIQHWMITVLDLVIGNDQAERDALRGILIRIYQEDGKWLSKAALMEWLDEHHGIKHDSVVSFLLLDLIDAENSRMNDAIVNTFFTDKARKRIEDGDDPYSFDLDEE